MNKQLFERLTCVLEKDSYLLTPKYIFLPSVCCLQRRQDVSIQGAVQGKILQTGDGQDIFPLQDVAKQLCTEGTQQHNINIRAVPLCSTEALLQQSV